MSGELFPVESVAVKSPRLLWCERHGITVTDRPKKPADERFIAHRSHLQTDGIGATAEEACRDFSVKNRVPSWSEEGGA